MSHITKVGIAVVENEQILLVRKQGSTVFILPGGKPEYGEDDQRALSRELDEELGCEIDLKSLICLGTFTDEAADQPGFSVTIRLYTGNLRGHPKPSSEIEQVCWHSLADNNKHFLAPSLRRQILPYLFHNMHRLS